MNAKRRKEIEKARGLIQEAKAILETAQGEEQDTFDNMPEGLQQGEKGEKVQAAAEALQEAVDACESIEENIDTAVE